MSTVIPEASRVYDYDLIGYINPQTSLSDVLRFPIRSGPAMTVSWLPGGGAGGGGGGGSEVVAVAPAAPAPKLRRKGASASLLPPNTTRLDAALQEVEAKPFGC